MSFQDEIYMIADELRSIANEGMRYADNDYDRKRYARLLTIIARLVSSIEKRPEDEVMEEYKQNLARVTPFVAASAAVFRDGCILLIKREDNGLWAMPGGWTEVGETWAQSVERELREETGLACTAKQLLGVFDSRLWGSRSKYHFYNSLWLVDLARRGLTIRTRPPARKRLTWVTSRSTTCLRSCRRDTHAGYRWLSSSRAEICRCPTSTRRPESRLAKAIAGHPHRI